MLFIKICNQALLDVSRSFNSKNGMPHHAQSSIHFSNGTITRQFRKCYEFLLIGGIAAEQLAHQTQIPKGHVGIFWTNFIFEASQYFITYKNSIRYALNKYTILILYITCLRG